MLIWTQQARHDVERLVGFLTAVDQRAAGRLAVQLVEVPGTLLETPRLGVRVERYLPREVRKLVAGKYIFHYELTLDAVYVLRVWHSREERL